MQRTVDPHYSSVVSPAASRGALADPVLTTDIDGIRTNGCPLPPAVPRGTTGGLDIDPRVPASFACRRSSRRSTSARSCSRMRNAQWLGGFGCSQSTQSNAFVGKRRSCTASGVRRASWPARSSRAVSVSPRNATWLILPVVICLSQRLSHACVSMN